MYIVEERTVGASLGEDNIRAGLRAAVGGYILVLLCMVIYYKGFGMIANIALAVNVILLVALMSVLGATLTMPGIAGIVLTMGMAVDANVLIFSRVREEALERPPQAAITAGFDRAFTTIVDSNITHLLVALMLLAIRHGPDQRLRRRADARHHHVDVHRHHRDARDGQSGVRRPQHEEAVRMSEPQRVINFMALRKHGAVFSIAISIDLDRFVFLAGSELRSRLHRRHAGRGRVRAAGRAEDVRISLEHAGITKPWCSISARNTTC